MQPNASGLTTFRKRQPCVTEALVFTRGQQVGDAQREKAVAFVAVLFDRRLVHRHDLHVVRVPSPHRQRITVEEHTIAALAVRQRAVAALHGLGHLVERIAEHSSLTWSGGRGARAGVTAFEGTCGVHEPGERLCNAFREYVCGIDGDPSREEEQRDVESQTAREIGVERRLRKADVDHPRCLRRPREAGQAHHAVDPTDWLGPTRVECLAGVWRTPPDQRIGRVTVAEHDASRVEDRDDRRAEARGAAGHRHQGIESHRHRHRAGELPVGVDDLSGQHDDPRGADEGHRPTQFADDQPTFATHDIEVPAISERAHGFTGRPECSCGGDERAGGVEQEEIRNRRLGARERPREHRGVLHAKLGIRAEVRRQP